MSLTSIVINDGLSDIKANKNRYGVARIIMKEILSYRKYYDAYEELEHGFLTEYKYKNNKGLYHASKSGNMKFIQHFIEKGSTKWNYALEGAARGGHINIIEYFIEKGAIKFIKGLDAAAMGGHRDAVDYFFKKGIALQYHTVNYAAMSGNLDLVKYLETQKCIGRQTYFSNGMIGAGIYNRKHIIDYYIDQGVKPTEGLLGAIYGGHFNLVKYCISKGFTQCDLDNGLMQAVRYKHFRMIKYFMVLGAKNWDKALEAAVEINNQKYIDLFISKGASNWITCFYIAKKFKHVHLIRFFNQKIDG